MLKLVLGAALLFGSAAFAQDAAEDLDAQYSELEELALDPESESEELVLLDDEEVSSPSAVDEELVQN